MRLIDADHLVMTPVRNCSIEEGGIPISDFVTHHRILAFYPTIDAVPVVHGRWDATGRYKFPSGAIAVRCSECGAALRESEFHLYNWNYCPVCGAKMDGESD